MELNELEKIGLAFISGYIAGNVLKEDDEKIKDSTEHKGKHSKSNEADITIEMGKLEGKEAKNFMDFIEKITKGGKE